MSLFSIKNIFASFLKFNIKRPKSTVSSKPKVLIIPYDALGDLVMTIPLFNALHKTYPSWQLEVLCSPRSYSIIEHHPAIHHIYTLDINTSFFKFNQQAKQELKKMYNQDFDILIYLGERLNSSTLWRLSNIKATKRFSLPYTKEVYRKKGFNPLKIHLFDQYIGTDNKKEIHFTKRMLSILPDLNIQPPQKIDFSLYLPSIKLPSLTFSLKHPSILFNPVGSQEGNTLTQKQSYTIINKLQELSFSIYIFDTPNNRQLIKDQNNSLLKWLPSPDIIIASKWIEMLDIVLTTDTSIGHIAAALLKKTIIMRNDESWRDCCDPIVENVTMLRSPSNNINDIPLQQIIHALN